MEVEHTGWARAQDRQSAESLLLTLEGVLEEVRRMGRAVSDPREPRLRWRLGWGVASAVTGCALLLALVRALGPRVPTPERPASAPEPRGALGSRDVGDFNSWLADTAARGPTRARPASAERALQGTEAPPLHSLRRGRVRRRLLGTSQTQGPVSGDSLRVPGGVLPALVQCQRPPSSLGQ